MRINIYFLCPRSSVEEHKAADLGLRGFDSYRGYQIYKLINNMQKSRVKARKLRNLMKNTINSIRFRIESFSFPKILILSWVILGFFSLFMKWINSSDPLISSNSINNVTSFTAYMTMILLFIILFLIFSFNKKEKMKKWSNIIFRDYIIIIFISLILFILSINSIWVITWLNMFSSDISYWWWIIMLLVSSIFLFVWGFLLKNDNSSKNSIYLNDSPDKKPHLWEEKNTKLPF